ncbi:hypothetical protein, partial [Aeromonas hydrophila]|uniref:hypothetical protein n=1 Tax=Aeromonas hydrophila TaxID=644 RepID=UPI00195BAE98
CGEGGGSDGIGKGRYILLWQISRIIKSWTPIPYVLAIQQFAQKDGCPDFYFAGVFKEAFSK